MTVEPTAQRGIFPNPIPNQIPGDWMVTSYVLAEEVLRADWRGFELQPGRPGMRFAHIPEGMTEREVHRQRRAEVHRAHFSLAQIERHGRQVCRQEAFKIVSKLRSSEGGDFQRAASNYVWAVAAILVGFNASVTAEAESLMEQLRVVPGRVWPDPATSGPIKERLMDLAEPSLATRRDNPQDDVFSTIASSGRTLSELRYEGLTWLMVAAVNSATMIARTAYVLGSCAEWRSTDPVVLAAVFDETLRLMPVVSYIARKSTQHQFLGDVAIAAGDVVIIDAWEANRDRQVFGETADVFSPGRAPLGAAPRWGLGFGAGPRTCLGEHLAREEAVDLLREAYRHGMEHAGEWVPGPGPLPFFSRAPVRFA